MKDLSEINNLLTRLEWVDIAFNGSDGQRGLLEQLNALMADKTTDGSLGLVPRLEQVLHTANETLVTVAALQDAMNEPIDLKKQRSIESSVRTAIEGGLTPLDARTEIIQRVADRSTEQIAQGMAGLELMSRTAQDTVNNTRREIEHVVSQVGTQLEDMLREVTCTLSADSLKKPLQDATKQAIIESSSKHASDELIEVHKSELKRAISEIKEDFRQYQQGFRDELIEVQQESSDRVLKIIGGRAPSQAIVELYDRVDLLETENDSLRKRIASNDSSDAILEEEGARKLGWLHGRIGQLSYAAAMVVTLGISGYLFVVQYLGR